MSPFRGVPLSHALGAGQVGQFQCASDGTAGTSGTLGTAMTPTQQRAEQLDVLDKLESMRVALDEAISTQRRVLAATAMTTPVLREPEPLWAWSTEAARIVGIDKTTMTQRARRGVRTGIARKVGGRWQIRLDLMAPSCGRRG